MPAILAQIAMLAAVALGSDVSLVVERSLASGKEQMALVFTGEGARLSLNANFLSVAAHETRLGLFQAEAMTAPLRSARETLEKDAASLKRRDEGYAAMGVEPLRPVAGAHEVEVRVTGRVLRSEVAMRERLLKLLETIWPLADWQAVDAAEVSLDKGGVAAVRYTGKSASLSARSRLACARRSELVLACGVPNFGSAYFLVPERNGP
jgi:hypothetical protein